MVSGDAFKPATLIEILRLRAEQGGNLGYGFLRDGDRDEVRLSFAELDRQARAIAATLQAKFKPGDRALLLYPPGLDYIAGFFGCLHAGIVAVPAYPPDPAMAARTLSRVSAIALDCGASVALTSAEMRPLVEQLFATGAAVAKMPIVETDRIEEASAPWRAPAIDGDTLAFLQYTSGSTGNPKGVMVSHANLLHNLDGLRLLSSSVAEGGHMVSWVPPYHDMGLIWGILLPLRLGISATHMSPLSFLSNPLRWLQAIARRPETVISGGPGFAYELCVRKIPASERSALDLRRWKAAVAGGEPLRLDSFARFAEAFSESGFDANAFIPGYGLAEATLMVSGPFDGAAFVTKRLNRKELERGTATEARENDPDAWPVVSSGRPLPNQSTLIVEVNSHSECAPNRVGEIWIAGGSVAGGYWNRPEETAATFNAHLTDGRGPFLRTGDLGFLDEGGYLFVTGRLKDLIIIRGRNHHPDDIEATVNASHPAVRPGCGAAFSTEAGGAEKLVIVQEVRNGDLQLSEVARAIQAAISQVHHIQVHAIVLLEPGFCPKTSSGKIRRRPCAEAYPASDPHSLLRTPGVRHIFVAPKLHLEAGGPSDVSNTSSAEQITDSAEPPKERAVVKRSAAEIEQWIVSAIAEMLEIDTSDVDVNATFDVAGLDSADAVLLVGDLQRWLGAAVPPTLLWEYSTTAALAAFLSESVLIPEEPETTDEPETDEDESRLAVPVAVVEERIESKRADEHAIAIIGLSCRFPKSPTPEAFWDVLRSSTDAISEESESRKRLLAGWDHEGQRDPSWKYWGGYLEGIDLFDAQFFHISPFEARRLDPQQRLLLEVAWEALETTGHAPSEFIRRRTGVYMGIGPSGYGSHMLERGSKADAALVTGQAVCIAANRVSYFLNLNGPSIAIDTACSSSLVAVHLACQSLRNSECEMALAGGVSGLLWRSISEVLAGVGAIAADGRCKTFDASADGYVRGEGCGIIVLRRLSDALADHDPILAIIRGSAVNQDGRTNGLTAPNGLAQERVIDAALNDAGVSSAEIDYVEAHGSGTHLGDPIEVEALGRAFLRSGRSRENPCLIGSVKTNIGHLEAAAGIAGLIKVVLCLNKEYIAPHLHLKKLNPLIRLEQLPFRIANEGAPWPRGSRPRRAGVSSFGFGGTNAHLVVEEAPARTSDPQAKVERPLHLLALSGANEQALREMAGKVSDFLAGSSEESIADVCFSLNAGRDHLKERAAVIADSRSSLRQELDRLRAGVLSPNIHRSAASRGRRPKLAFLFSGQGSQYRQMGRVLYQTQPTFRTNLKRCSEIVKPLLERPLLSVVYPEGGAGPELDDTLYTQTALFALEYSLAMLWRSWGIEPDAVLGHSVGECVAACVAGAFTLEEGLCFVVERARLMQSVERGEMVAVLASEAQLREAMVELGNKLSVAAINGPREIVVSGRHREVSELITCLAARAVETVPLRVSHAFHSELLAPIADRLLQLGDRFPSAPLIAPLISNSTGRVIDAGAKLSREHWREHALRTVRFADGINALVGMGCAAFLEIGPEPVLTSLAKKCISEGEMLWLSSLRKRKDDWSCLLESLGKLYSRGFAIDWRGFDRDYARHAVPVPTYAFQRRSYWYQFPEEPDLRAREVPARETAHRGPAVPAHAKREEKPTDRLPAEMLDGGAVMERQLELVSEVITRQMEVLGAPHHSEHLLTPRNGSTAARGLTNSISRADIQVVPGKISRDVSSNGDFKHRGSPDPPQQVFKPLAPSPFARANRHDNGFFRENGSRSGNASSFRNDPKTLHGLLEVLSSTAPRAIALVLETKCVCRDELDGVATDFACRLKAEGMKPGTRAGVLARRPENALILSLSILKAGGAFEVLTRNSTAGKEPRPIPQIVVTDGVTEFDGLGAVTRLIAIDCSAEQDSSDKPARLIEQMGADTAAFFLPTGGFGDSASETICHDAALKMFARLDKQVGCDPGDVLAVTSAPTTLGIVAQLWALSRGARLTFASLEEICDRPPSAPQSRSTLPLSLSYFGSYDRDAAEPAYRALLEQAKFADRHGFTAIWVPERHFHEFGGIFPNPSVICSALAAVTSRIQLRAGSVVVPLHNPIRIAEEWACVDNLSNGRTGLAFASGWHPNDFALAPDAFEDRREVMTRGIETVQKLWAGEPVESAIPEGKRLQVKLHPRPVQAHLPIWLTSVSSTETYEKAGSIGAGVLTNLTSQSLSDLERNIGVYRDALARGGFSRNQGNVTLMLHTYLDDRLEDARERARKPLIDYFRSSVQIFKTFATARGESLDLSRLDPEDVDYLLSIAFDRYAESTSLIGTAESCMATIARMRQIGVDEIACLVDFGIDQEATMRGIERLAALVDDRPARTGATPRNDHRPTLVLGKPSELTSIAPERLGSVRGFLCDEPSTEQILSSSLPICTVGATLRTPLN